MASHGSRCCHCQLSQARHSVSENEYALCIVLSILTDDVGEAQWPAMEAGAAMSAFTSKPFGVRKCVCTVLSVCSDDVGEAQWPAMQAGAANVSVHKHAIPCQKTSMHCAKRL